MWVPEPPQVRCRRRATGGSSECTCGGEHPWGKETVLTPLGGAKRPVSAALAGPYAHPFHPMLVTVPIGAWVCSLVFDIASYVVESPGFLAKGSTWLIGIGVVGALAAAVVGFLDLTAIPTGSRAFRTGLVHMTLNLVV